MNQLEVALAARAFRDGHGIRKAALRHRHLVERPIATVMYQLGAEPFSAAALGFGCSRRDLKIVVAGEPRNRDLAFAALFDFACWFNPKFESSAAVRELITKGNWYRSRARTAPQIVVANSATVEMIGRLGRRLAYLPLVGPNPAPPELIRLGQHFLFLHRHSGMPGQQLIVPMTDLLNEHWITPQSPMERQSLAALDAYIEPPKGIHGYDAAAAAESAAIGPLPGGEDDEKLEPLMEEFNSRRRNSTTPAVVTSLLRPIRAHYAPLIERTWDLVWTSHAREATWSEAPSAQRRWDEDRQAYTDHIDWTFKFGRRRTRQSPRQAAMLMRRLEEAKALVESERACEDPLLIIPDLMSGKAIQGIVLRIDETHFETASVRAVRRPLVTISSPDRCLVPLGKELWWTRLPGAAPYLIVDVGPQKGGGSLTTLKLTTSSRTQLPKVGEEACFSIHTTRTQWLSNLPPSAPWTHRPPNSDRSGSIEGN
jgi:hypothetical protein